MRRRLAAWARAAAPREACGLLLGHRGGAQLAVVRATREANLARGLDAFELDPVAIVRATGRARASRLELVGTWHSHPRGAARFSTRDAAGAFGGAASLLVALRGEGRMRMRAAWAQGGALIPLALAPEARGT